MDGIHTQTPHRFGYYGRFLVSRFWRVATSGVNNPDRFKKVKKLYREAGNVPDKRGQGPYGDTAVIQTVSCRDIEMTTLLLSMGVNLTAVNFTGRTVLDVAIDRGSTTEVELLLNANADPNARATHRSDTPLNTAVDYLNAGTVNLLLDHGASMHVGCREHGWTPLHVAARHDMLAMLELLLDRGANIFLRDLKGYNPVRHAVKRGCVRTTKALLARNPAEATNTDPAGHTLLHSAAKANVLEIVKILMEAGAIVNAEDSYGVTPLLVSAAHTDEVICNYLLEHGAVNVCAKDDYGRTMLHILADRGSLLVERVLRMGADIDACNDEGESSLEFAVKHNHLDVVRVLCDNGSDLRDGEGESVAILAEGHGFHQCAAIIRVEAVRRDTFIAFAMGIHDRLGCQSPVLALDKEVIHMIADMVQF